MKRKIIDGHYHTCQWFAGNESYFEALQKYRQTCGIEAVNVLCLPNLKDLFPNRDMTQNILAAILKLEDETVYAQGGLFYPEHPVNMPLAPEFEFKRQAEELMAIGFDGMKMLESKPNAHKLLGYAPDLPGYEAYFAYLEAENIPLLWHVNDPDDFWDADKAPENAKSHGWFYGDGTFASKEQIYGEVFAVLERHPKLRVVFPHCFFMSREPERIKTLFETYENVYIDLTPGPEMYPSFTEQYDIWRNIFNQYYKRILFGTDLKNDTPMEMKQQLVQETLRFLTTTDVFHAFAYFDMDYTLRGFGLEEDKLDCILHQNFIDLMGSKPRKIDKAALKAHIERRMPLIPEGRTKEMILQYCRERL
ncbi:MAG: amidohydrolase family protein [Clostridia bacterium]